MVKIILTLLSLPAICSMSAFADVGIVPAPKQANTPKVKVENRTFSLIVGGKKSISLSCNPGLNYGWIISEGAKSEIVSVKTIVAYMEIQPETPGLLPPATTTVFFTGLKPGKEKVVLTYAKLGEQPIKPEKIITVEVEVTNGVNHSPKPGEFKLTPPVMPEFP